MPDSNPNALLHSGSQLLDVRPLLAAGEEPFAQIMSAADALKPGQGLALRAPFEPKPLFSVFAARGFEAHSHCLAPGDWLVEFLPQAGAPKGRVAAEAVTPAVPTGAPALLVVDVRGLEPPEPLVRILGACQGLEPGQTLKVLHERRPSLLYPRLESLGYLHQTFERAEDVFEILVTRPGQHPA